MDGDIEAQTKGSIGAVSSQRRVYSIRNSILTSRRQQNPKHSQNATELTHVEKFLAPSSYHKIAIDLLFGLPHSYLIQWPGILAFFAHLETQFARFFDDRRDGAKRLLPCPDPGEKDLVIGWEWCFAVSRALKEVQSEELDIPDTSVGSVLDRILQQNSLSAQALDRTETDEAYRAVFASICWMSMTLRPAMEGKGPRPPQGSASWILGAWVEGSKQALSPHSLRRPVTKMFRMFRQGAGVPEQNQPSYNSPGNPAIPTFPIADHSETLYQSSLNFFSLKTIGHVRLEWVDTITGHLRFNHQQRTLSLFRFPTMCIVNIVSKNGPRAFKRITQELLPQEYWMEYFHDDDDQTSTSVYREVLLSYRLLFAQSARSRKLIKQELDQLRSNLQADVDPFLVTLCNAPLKTLQQDPGLPKNIFPYSALNEYGTLQESDAYSVREDFPCFGSRLLGLQRYNMRRQPSKVMDLWRDQRNPLQWYTFWAVLWVGGITVLLSLLQLFVGVAQLYFAAVQG